MNIAGDYLRVIEGGDHLERKKLKVTILVNRITYAKEQVHVTHKSEKQDLHGICVSSIQILEKVSNSLTVITSDVTLTAPLAETFQLYNLDLQARDHYAPNDSPIHIAEKVMRSLNEHAGDGKNSKAI